MKLKLAVLPFLVLVILAGLVSCNLLGGATGTMVIGSVHFWYGGTVPGGTAYHVVFYDQATPMNPLSDYATAPQAASIAGKFPGGASDSYDTGNFQSTDVPAGLYSVFVWVDSDGSGDFYPSGDSYGFYYGDPAAINTAQPPSNVIVPEKGIVDLDVWVGRNNLG